MRSISASVQRGPLLFTFLTVLPVFGVAAETGELEQLRQMLAAQQAQIDTLQQAVKRQQATLDAQQKLLQGTSEQQDIPDQTDRTALTVQAVQTDKSAAVKAQSIALSGSKSDDANYGPQGQDPPEHPKAASKADSFLGSWPLPDTNARLRIGGYVKMNIVDNLDPLQTKDRFIVGTIPPSGTVVEGAEKDISLTVAQSRVNLELRDQSEVGDLRAFVEGDFAGDGDTFRLRHAFGQFREMLAGKTWSTLMDLETAPEELDFEGINGQINVRQAQLRFFPTIRDFLNFTLSLEDPSPDVSGGTGISELPDVVIGIDNFNFGFLQRMNARPGWGARLALIHRQIKAREGNSGSKVSTSGWGVTASGHIPAPFWADNDKLLWQLTYGDGIGRYVNDLGTIGGQDAIFSPSGKLQTWQVFAGYFSYQHWWRSKLRSNLTFSWVKVDTYDFQSTPSYIDQYGDPYEQTLRASLNLIYSPIARVDLGAEYLWGQRKNANNSEGQANQIQFSAKYHY